MTNTDYYHDYVIREGELIGRFEEMYQQCEDPWHQDEGDRLKEQIALLTLLDADKKIESMLDIGCGKGRFTRLLVDSLKPKTVTGMDVSPTALDTAAERNPEQEFLAVDVPPIPVEDDSFDLVVAAEVFWYVLTSLKTLLQEIDRVLEPGGLVLVLLYFPDDQQYGNEIVDSTDDLLELVPFNTVKTIRIDNDGQQFIGLFRTVS
ncbi:MAG: class I SAM-dependent methyltransferase [Halobacteriaceae archaeon]